MNFQQTLNGTRATSQWTT